MKKRMNIPCQFSSEVVVNTNLVPVKITALHSDENRNSTYIGLDTIKSASKTLCNKPILAYIRETADGQHDFAGHEIDIDWTEDGEIKRKFYEYPVGIIPESTQIEYYEENGKTYLTCTAYIYKEYSNETIDLINQTDGKCVSVEIAIHDGEPQENGIYNITSFSFLGITILSDEVTPGMDENCTIKFIRDVENYQDFLNKAMGDVVKFEKENKDISVDEPVNEENTSKETPAGENQDDTGKDESVKKKEDEQAEPTEQGIPTEEPTKDEEPVQKEEPVQNEDGKDEPENIPDTPKGEEPVQTEEPIQSEEPIIVPDTVSEFSEFNKLFNTEVVDAKHLMDLFLEKINSLTNENKEKDFYISTLEEEINSYRQSEREARINDLLQTIGYTFDDEEIEKPIQMAKNFEITLEELRKELFAIIGEKNLKNSTRKNVSTYSGDGIILVNPSKGNRDKELLPYADLFDGIL